MTELNIIRSIHPGLSLAEGEDGKRYLVREIAPDRKAVYEKASGLSLPIPKIHYVGYDGAMLQYLVIEELISLNGDSSWFALEQFIPRLKGNETAISVGLGRVLSAISEVHDAGFAHGSLTPRSIVFRPSGEVCLAELSCIQYMNGSLTPCVAYSRIYVCREQLDGIISPATDIRLIGLSFLTAYLGHHPMEPDSVAEGQRASHIADNEVVFNSGSKVLRLLSRMTSVEPSDRPTIHEALAALSKILNRA